jgi:hypothetical protein
VREADPSAGDLTVARPTAQLADQLDNLAQRRCAERFTLGQQPA